VSIFVFQWLLVKLTIHPTTPEHPASENPRPGRCSSDIGTYPSSPFVTPAILYLQLTATFPRCIEMIGYPGTNDSSITIPYLDSLATAPLLLSEEIGNGIMSHGVPFLNKQTTPRFYCAFCEKYYDRQARFSYHLNGHLSLKPFTCDGRCGSHGW
jgi:hypothetical protein